MFITITITYQMPTFSQNLCAYAQCQSTICYANPFVHCCLIICQVSFKYTINMFIMFPSKSLDLFINRRKNNEIK
jgi:hypothetical protein